MAQIEDETIYVSLMFEEVLQNSFVFMFHAQTMSDDHFFTMWDLDI